MAFTQLIRDGDEAKFPTMREMKDKAFACFSQQTFNAQVSYDDLTRLLLLDPRRDLRARAAVLSAGRKVLTEQNKKIVNIRNVGYRIVNPNEHVFVSQAEQKKARRWFSQSLKTVTHVALEHLTPTEIARLMTEQARTAIQVAMTKRLSKEKELPPTHELQLPSGSRLVEMMRKK